MNKTFLNFLDSQKLSRLGIKSDSGFFYNKKTKELHWNKDLFLGMANFESTFVPAYTDADLNEALPDKLYDNRKNINAHKYDLVIRKTRHGKYTIEYENQIKEAPCFVMVQEHTEVEAKAQLIIILSRKNLLKN